jgi:hypothetical protein
MGAFFLSAVTGVLMFFHLDRGLNKPAHEWLGWLMVAGVGVHAAVNWVAFKRYFKQPMGRVIVGALVLLTALSFWQPAGAPKASPARQASQALANAPLDLVAQVARRDAASLRAVLTQKGLTVPDGQPTLTEIARASQKPSTEVLALVFEATPARP